MDDEKKTVLVAALSAYAELLAKNTAQLELEQGKGKGKASDDDVDLKAEIHNQIKLCGELSNQITDTTSGNDIARTFNGAWPEPWNQQDSIPRKDSQVNKFDNGNSWDNTSFQGFYAPAATSNDPKTRNPSKLHQHSTIEDEPYINPFTGLPVLPETGYEAGPSNSPPPPLRTAPRPPIVPSRPLSRQVKPPLSQAPVRPPPKPQHLRARPLVPFKPTLDLSLTLPPQRLPPPPPQSPHSTLAGSATLPPQWATSDLPPPFLEQKQQCPQQTLTTSAPSEYGPTTEQFWNTSSLASVQPPISSPPPYNWEADIQDVREAVPQNQHHITKHMEKNRYLRHITEIASKVLKATGSMINTTQKSSLYHNISPSTRYMDNVPENLPVDVPAELPGSAINSEPSDDLPGKETQESSPPAYDSLSDIHRRSSLASNSTISVAESRMWSLSSAFSSRSSLSPTSPIICSSPGPLDEGIQTLKRPAYASFKPQLRKSTRPTATPLVATDLPRSISVSALPILKQGVKERGSFSNAFFTGPKNPSSITGRNDPAAETRESHLDRRKTTSNPSRTNMSNFADRQIPSNTMLARHLSLEHNHTGGQKQPSRLSSPSLTFPSIAHDRAQSIGQIRTLRSILTRPLSPPNSSNPWKSHMEADQAFARYLQLQEELELQMERDMLLAYKIANGTADEADHELGYFMHQESTELIESTVVPGSMTQRGGGSDLWGMDGEELRRQSDWLEAKRLDEEFQLKNRADDASFAEAKKLQEQFNQEVRNEEAWEQWKRSNVETCISCMENHAREELVQECEHGYCNSCLQDGFKTALDSRTPFKCCNKLLPIGNCLGLTDGFVAEYSVSKKNSTNLSYL